MTDDEVLLDIFKRLLASEWTSLYSNPEWPDPTKSLFCIDGSIMLTEKQATLIRSMPREED